MCDVQLAGKGIFQHTGASLVMAQLNDSSFIAEDIWTIPVSIYHLYISLYLVIHCTCCLHCNQIHRILSLPFLCLFLLKDCDKTVLYNKLSGFACKHFTAPLIT